MGLRRGIVLWTALFGLFVGGIAGVGAKAAENPRLVPLLDAENLVLGGKVVAEADYWSGWAETGLAPGYGLVHRVGISGSLGARGQYGVDYGKRVGGTVPGWELSRGVLARLSGKGPGGGEVRVTAFGGELIPSKENPSPDSQEAVYLNLNYRETTRLETVVATTTLSVTTGLTRAYDRGFHAATLHGSITRGRIFLDLAAGFAGGGEGLPDLAFRPGTSMPVVHGFEHSGISGDRFASATIGYRRELVQDSARHPWFGGLSGEVFADAALLAQRGERLCDADSVSGYGVGLVMPMPGFDLRFDLGWSSRGEFVPSLRMAVAR